MKGLSIQSLFCWSKNNSKRNHQAAVLLPPDGEHQQQYPKPLPPPQQQQQQQQEKLPVIPTTDDTQSSELFNIPTADDVEEQDSGTGVEGGTARRRRSGFSLCIPLHRRQQRRVVRFARATVIVPDDSIADDREWYTADEIIAAEQQVIDMQQENNNSYIHDTFGDLLYQRFRAAADDQTCFEIMTQHVSELQAQNNNHSGLSIPANQVGLSPLHDNSNGLHALRTQRLLYRQVARLQQAGRFIKNGHIEQQIATIVHECSRPAVMLAIYQAFLIALDQHVEQQAHKDKKEPNEDTDCRETEKVASPHTSETQRAFQHNT